MKLRNFLLTGIFCVMNTVTAQANTADYRCELGAYRLDFSVSNDKSAHLSIEDTVNHTNVAQGYAKTIEERNNITGFYFYFPEGETLFTMRSSDVTSLPEEFPARVRGTARGMLFGGRISCVKSGFFLM